jgi:hypothetical protein
MQPALLLGDFSYTFWQIELIDAGTTGQIIDSKGSRRHKSGRYYRCFLQKIGQFVRN